MTNSSYKIYLQNKNKIKMKMNFLETTPSSSVLLWCALLVVSLLLASVFATHLYSSRAAAAHETFASGGGSDAPAMCHLADPTTNALVTGANFHVRTAESAPYSGDAPYVYTMERANNFDPFTALQREYWSGRQCEMALGQQAIAESSVERDYADFIPRIVGAAGRARLFLLWGTPLVAGQSRALRAHVCVVYVYIERGEPRSDRLLLIAETRAGLSVGDRTAIDLALPPPRIMFRPVSVTVCFESDTPGTAPVVLQSIALQIGDGVHFCSVSPACGMGFFPVASTDQLQRTLQTAHHDTCRSVPTRTHWKVNLVGPREPHVAFLQTKWFCVDLSLRLRRSVPAQLPNSAQPAAEPSLLPPFRPSAYITTQAGTVSQFTASAPSVELVPGWVQTHYSAAPTEEQETAPGKVLPEKVLPVLPVLPAPPGVRMRMRVAFATVADPGSLAKDGSNERADAKTVTGAMLENLENMALSEGTQQFSATLDIEVRFEFASSAQSSAEQLVRAWVPLSFAFPTDKLAVSIVDSDALPGTLDARLRFFAEEDPTVVRAPVPRGAHVPVGYIFGNNDSSSGEENFPRNEQNADLLQGYLPIQFPSVICVTTVSALGATPRPCTTLCETALQLARFRTDSTAVIFRRHLQSAIVPWIRSRIASGAEPPRVGTGIFCFGFFHCLPVTVRNMLSGRTQPARFADVRLGLSSLAEIGWEIGPELDARLVLNGQTVISAAKLSVMQPTPVFWAVFCGFDGTVYIEATPLFAGSYMSRHSLPRGRGGSGPSASAPCNCAQSMRHEGVRRALMGNAAIVRGDSLDSILRTTPQSPSNTDGFAMPWGGAALVLSPELGPGAIPNLSPLRYTAPLRPVLLNTAEGTEFASSPPPQTTTSSPPVQQNNIMLIRSLVPSVPVSMYGMVLHLDMLLLRDALRARTEEIVGYSPEGVTQLLRLGNNFSLELRRTGIQNATGESTGPAALFAVHRAGGNSSAVEEALFVTDADALRYVTANVLHVTVSSLYGAVTVCEDAGMTCSRSQLAVDQLGSESSAWKSYMDERVSAIQFLNPILRFVAVFDQFVPSDILQRFARDNGARAGVFDLFDAGVADNVPDGYELQQQKVYS